jgi:phage baseplate assembly protein gpV
LDSSKTLNNIRLQAGKMKAPMVRFLDGHLRGYGNLVDQLRVMGWLGQAMVDMANAELAALKLQDEAENREPAVKVYQ